MKSNARVVIIGRPNVGKSSLFNRIVGKRQAIVHEVAGTTRDIISETVSIEDKSFELFDTAGYLIEKNGPFTKETVGKIGEAVGFADVLIFVVDGNVPPTREDKFIADIARKSGKQVVLAINKLDNSKGGETQEYIKFGFKDMYQISAIHNLGMGEFLDGTLRLLTSHPELVSGSPEIPDQARDDKYIKVSIIGRPNVGKSSILNSLVKKERAIVSEIPGTTRDVISEIITTEGFDMKISDTAGARKPGKIGKAALRGEPVEKYSFLRTEREVENSDIVLVVLDASEKIAAQDLHIAGMAKEAGKGIVILVNKWDLAEDITQEKYLARLRHYFSFMIWVPVVFVSAKTGRNIDEILAVVKKVAENQRTKIPTSKFNRILEEFVAINPPKGRGPFKPKVFFASQTGVVPPTFTISAKHHAIVHFSWRRALENELRRHFDFTGTPMRIIFKAK